MASLVAQSPNSAETVENAAGQIPWPKSRYGWYAVAILAIVLMFSQVEAGIIPFLISPIKRDFGINDLQVSLLVGVAPSIFYSVVSLPLARLIDTFRRNVTLSIALGLVGLTTSAAGIAQSLWQFSICRVLVGGGSAVSNPGSYSLIADYFPRARLTRAIAVLTIGLILGRSLAPVLVGGIVGLTASWPTLHYAGLAIRTWQYAFMLAGCLGITGALLMLTVREPPRRILAGTREASPTLWQVLAYVWQHKALYGPQFCALAFAVIETYGIEAWRVEFLRRTYGWTPAMAGPVLGGATLAAQLSGLVIGTRVAEWLAKTHDDANLRTTLFFYTINPLFAVIGPLMPSPWLAIACACVTGMCGMACVPAQNAAIQSITPNKMRGQITALYYFVLAIFGIGLGPSLMAFLTDVVFGDETKLRYAMSASAAVAPPLAAVSIWLAIKPYGRAIAEIRKLEEKA